MLEPVPETPLTDTDGGRAPDGNGWFVVNVAEAAAFGKEGLGAAAIFEGAHRFPEFGINVHVVAPGEPSSMYHRENAQESFLVLSGECVAIVEDQERRLRRGDFLHTPPGTAHVLIGAGTEPCAILMAGTRKGEAKDVLYPVSEVAARYGASVPVQTTDPREAYKHLGRSSSGPLGRVPW